MEKRSIDPRSKVGQVRESPKKSRDFSTGQGFEQPTLKQSASHGDHDSSSEDSKEGNTPKGQSEVTRKTKDFSTGQGFEQPILKQPASHGDRNSSSEENKTKDIVDPLGVNKDITSDVGSRQSPESSQRRAGSSRRGELYLNAIKERRGLQGRQVWVDKESIPVYIPGRWEGSKLKKICVDRTVAAWRELAKGHPERILRRLTGKIPNEELYRFFKHADLKPGTYIDLGAGGGNFIHALGKVIDPEKMQIYAIDKDQAAYDKLREIASENDKVKALHGDYTNEHFFEELRNNEGISNVSGILWANNGHYYSPEKRGKLMKQMKSTLKDDGKLLIVEYNTFKQHGPDGMYNKYPLSKKQLKIELEQAGFENVEFLQKLPSSDQYMMYSAVATAPKRSEDKDVS